MKNRLSRKTREQFEELLEAVYQEGLEEGKASVDKFGFKTERRVAKVGERILIVNPDDDSAGNKGEIFNVIYVGLFSGKVDVKEIQTNNYGYAFDRHEYEVIIEPVQVPVIELLTPNEQRAELIEKAKSFVEVNTRKKTSSFQKNSYFVKSNLGVVEEFIVNEEKRTVVCLLKGARVPKVYFKGIAKCMPNEVFNEHIGKAIALARALEIDVPQEFMDAVQPTEKVVGMVVDWDGRVREIARYKGRIDDNICQLGSDTSRYGKIINDTNAKYGKNE